MTKHLLVVETYFEAREVLRAFEEADRRGEVNRTQMRFKGSNGVETKVAVVSSIEDAYRLSGHIYQDISFPTGFERRHPKEKKYLNALVRKVA